MKKLIISATSLLILAACQQHMFGVDETTWATLNEKEREEVIRGYNQRKQVELENGQKRKEKELENERHRQEVEAQTAPFYAAADAISSICGEKNCDVKNSNRIQEVGKKGLRKIVVISDTKFEVAPLSNMSDAWLKGQKVALSRNENDRLYSVKIHNLDNGETVSARKSKN